MSSVCVLAQLVGGVFGFWLLQILTPTKIFDQSAGLHGVCQTYPHEDMGELDTFFIEYISTMFWISMYCTVWDPNIRSYQNSLLPLIFGLALTVLNLIFVSVII